MKKTFFLLFVIGIAASALFGGAAMAEASSYTPLLSHFNVDTLSMAGMGIGMTTLAVNTPRDYELGERNHYPVIASDIIYEGGAVGIVSGTGHARPLTSVDKFGGFAVSKADNSAGAAAAIYVEAVKSGEVSLSVSGAVITDVGQPVYATDDNTFVFSPVGGVFVGFVKRFVSSGVVIVEFDADSFIDPYGEYTVRETVAADLTLDIQDNGKLLWFTTDTKIITLPAVATPVNCKIVNGAAFGTALLTIAPNVDDKIQGPNLPGTNNTALLNTKATQKRGDFVKIITGDANGPIVSELRGTWASA